MKAVIITEPGGPEVLNYQESPVPIVNGNNVLIKVFAAGVNRPDIMQRKGKYPAPEGSPANIPGLEISGVISACGELVTKWKPGDKVCALIAGGGYAEYALADENSCLPIPDHLSFTEAAALPETVFTVWHNVFRLGKLTAGQNFLVHGGSSGIGVTAIQLAAAKGCNVFTTAGSDEKCKACINLGASVAVNYKKEDFETVLQKDGVDVILDMIGGDYLAKNINLLNENGKLVFINAMKGNAPIDIFKVMTKRLTITGSTLRSRSVAFKANLAQDVKENVWPLIDNQQFKPVIFKTFALENACEAHILMESSTHVGKIILLTRFHDET